MKMLETAIRAAKEAGKIQLKFFRKNIAYKKKSKYDIVTKVDILSEKKIIEIIKKRFPKHNILAEEGGAQNNNSEYTWVIDPLDGTVNYSNGRAVFGISIGVTKNGDPIAGVLYDPYHKELMHAQKGKGCFLNGKRVRVSIQNRLIESVVEQSLSSQKKYRQKTLKDAEKYLAKVRSVRMGGSSIISLLDLAVGRFEGAVKTTFHWWDVAAGIILVQEAGGKVTDFNGKKVTEQSENMIASNGKIHAALRKLLSKR